MFVHLDDMPGKKFGLLTVISRAENNSRGAARFLCRCDCGREAVVGKGGLTRDEKGTKSCGCLRSKSALAVAKREPRGAIQKVASRLGITNRKVIERLYSARRAAKFRHLEWGLSHEEALLIILQPCFYCRKPSGDVPGGIDRIDSSIGYRPENCVPACGECNVAKNDMSLTEFRDWLVRLHTAFIVRPHLNNPLPMVSETLGEATPNGRNS